jgi:hypothetical protein
MYERQDNRMFKITAPESSDVNSATVDLQATGREPIIMTTDKKINVSYDSSGTTVDLPAGTYLYELQHPFAGQFFIRTDSSETGSATVVFMVAAAVARGGING